MKSSYYDIDTLMQIPEDELTEDIIPIINILIKKRQFSEKFLFKFIDAIDPYICLKYQKNLSINFCFDNLYNKMKPDGFICFNDITDYFQNKYTLDEIRHYFITRKN